MNIVLGMVVGLICLAVGFFMGFSFYHLGIKMELQRNKHISYSQYYNRKEKK